MLLTIDTIIILIINPLDGHKLGFFLLAKLSRIFFFKSNLAVVFYDFKSSCGCFPSSVRIHENLPNPGIFFLKQSTFLLP